MAQENSAAKPERPKLGVRAGVSRKLLEKKAAERAAEELVDGASLEADFPAAELSGGIEVATEPTLPPATAELPGDASVAAVVRPGMPVPGAGADGARAAVEPPSSTATAALTQPASATQLWSDEDEKAFQTLAARRKVAGYQRRGRNVGGQLITVGAIKPNDNTVVAVIVGVVAERGSVGRAELLNTMAGTAFPHRAARPGDRGWCQGYVAGALRDGFLALAEPAAAAASLAA